MSESTDELTLPEERRERIAAILAKATRRLAEHQRRMAAGNLPPSRPLGGGLAQHGALGRIPLMTI